MSGPIFCFTADVDWASEYCISQLRSLLEPFEIPATIFVTHRSAELEHWNNVELAIHPNFLPGSSHGSTVAEVIDHVLNLVPSARSFRSHCFFDNSHVTRELWERGIRYDSNLCLHLQPNIVPLHHSSGLLRYPVFFEDDVAWARNVKWDMDLDPFFCDGLKILNFHPFMLAINCPNISFYSRVRQHIPTLDAERAKAICHDGIGERDFLLRLLTEVRRRGLKFYTLGELFENGSGRLSDDQRGRQSRHSDDDYRRYWSLSDQERQEFVRASYAQRDPKDPYATSRDYNARELEIQSIVENVLPGIVLDLGCGNGFTLLRVAEKVSGRFTGVDFSEHLIGGACELAEAAQVANRPTFICADAIRYLREQSTDSIDCIISERFIQNLPSVAWQEQVLADIFRVLRPGGRALICEGSEVGFERLNDLREKVGLSRIPATSADNISAIRLNDSSFEQYCKQVGFTLSRKCGYSLFFLITRVLHPLLVAPQAPRFDAEINNLARAIQSHSPFEPGFGGNELWILEKPASEN